MSISNVNRRSFFTVLGGGAATGALLAALGPTPAIPQAFQPSEVVPLPELDSVLPAYEVIYEQQARR